MPAVCPDIAGDDVLILIHLASQFNTIIKIPKNKPKTKRLFIVANNHINLIIPGYKVHCHIVENAYWHIKSQRHSSVVS